MLRSLFASTVALAALAAPALADDAAPTQREVASAVDAYLASADADASLVAGPGTAGYDGGFWIRGGTFLLKINLTIQTRWEGFDWDDNDVEPSPGGDLSGFSLPRVTLKLSGDATCNVHYYAELEFGHHGSWLDNENGAESITSELFFGPFVPFGQIKFSPDEVDYGIAREAWIEWESCPWLAVRMGLVKTAATRQLMTPPELQQFVDISLASAFIGQTMPGYSDRNRDYGVMVHGAFGCDGEFSYMVTVTNGDGPVRRNVLDGFTSDNFAYSARVNWDLRGHMGYEEGALRQHECAWTAAVGAWAHYYADAALHRPFVKFADRLTWGVDAAAGWGGLSFTGAYSAFEWDSDSFGDVEGTSWLVQLGYLFPGTAWEIAARASGYTFEAGGFEAGAIEYAGAVTYYIDGHADKVTLDASFISPEDDGHFVADTYAGYAGSTGDSDAVLVRLQWQLAV